MIALLPFCFSFISAAGLENLIKSNNIKVYWYLALTAVLVALTFFFFHSVPFSSDVNNNGTVLYFTNQRLATVLFLLTYSILVAIFLFTKRQALVAILVSLVLLLNFTERSFLLGGNEGASYPEAFYPVTPAIKFLENIDKSDRVVIVGRHFIPSFPLFYSINSLTGHAYANYAFKKNLEEINPGLYGWKMSTTQPRFTPDLINFESSLLDLYRVRYIVTSPSDSPVWLKSVAVQSEYNQPVKLDQLQSIGQSFTSLRTGELYTLEIRALFYNNENPVGVGVKIISEGSVLEDYEGQLRLQENGYYSIDIPGIRVKEGQTLSFVISPVGTTFPENSYFYAVDNALFGGSYDIYSGGQLIVDGQPKNSDMAFRVLQYDLEIAEKYRQVHSGDLNIYENMTLGDSLPVVEKLVYSDKASCTSKLSQIDIFEEAIIEDDGIVISGTPSNSSAIIRSYTANTITIDADIKQTAMVIVSDTYYPGWQAKIDDQQTEIYLVNCAMRGVIVEPGKHVIKMSYNPSSFRNGFIISISTLLFLILFPFITRKRGKG
jgi:hypothetical protein